MGRPGMSDAMKVNSWRQWRAGDSISVISRALGKPPGSVFTVLKHHGGIASAERVRRADRLSAEDRESISRGLEAGASLRSIAVSIGLTRDIIVTTVRSTRILRAAPFRSGNSRMYQPGAATTATANSPLTA